MRAIVLFTLALSGAAVTFSGEKIHPRLIETLASASSRTRLPVWVYLRDKGSYESLSAAVPAGVVSQRSYTRRLKARAPECAVDYTDLPVETLYIQALSDAGFFIRNVSRWFNAVSVLVDQGEVQRLATFPFVRSIEPLARFKRSDPEPLHQDPRESSSVRISKSFAEFNYGPSAGQINQINVAAVHNTGNYGQGVLVGVFDNGFRLLQHQVFDSLRNRIVATYDYVDRKVSVVPNNPDPAFGSHGIVTFSTLAGFKEGELIGPAFGASFILARTENDSSETPLEEDNWVAAIEWADSLGVDVTSTSLGYLTYDPPYPSWTWESMDGNTTVITRAADMAVSKGIIVVNSAGNNGGHPTRNTLNAPADGDSVLSVGAVGPDGLRASFSSVGPTLSNPPRIKPDVMAQGASVRAASPTDPTGYIYSGGTSLSCPLAAGVAALLVRANPSANPIEILSAMRQTASRASTPNNEYGWGILDAFRAVQVLTSSGGTETLPTRYAIRQNYPNPFNASTIIPIDLPLPSSVLVVVYNVLGQRVKELANISSPAATLRLSWDGTNSVGSPVASGIYVAHFVAISSDGSVRHASSIKLLLSK